jgi:tetratricopeptide (TPR) repeat protein
MHMDFRWWSTLRAGLLASVCFHVLFAQKPDCLVQLERPHYPPMSWGSEDQREIDLVLRIESGGKPFLAGKESDDELATEASRVAGLSIFADACSGQSLEIKFRFELKGENSIEREATVSFEKENAIVISARPPAALCDRAVTNEEQAMECFGQGTQLSLSKRYDEAIRCFDRKLAFAPEADAYVERGIARRKSGQLRTAIEDYDEAIRLKPNNGIAYFNRGNVNRDMGLDQEAIRDYSEAIRVDPMRLEAFGNRGVRYLSLGMLQPAIQDFTKLIEAQPRERKAYLNRGVAYVQLNQPEQAILDFDQAIQLAPLEADAFNNRAFARFRLGQHELALTDYGTAIGLSSDYVEAWLGRGGVHQSLGLYKEAENDLTTAIRLAPDSAVGYQARGEVRLQKGDREGAAADLNKAKELCGPTK